MQGLKELQQQKPKKPLVKQGIKEYLSWNYCQNTLKITEEQKMRQKEEEFMML